MLQQWNTDVCIKPDIHFILGRKTQNQSQTLNMFGQNDKMAKKKKKYKNYIQMISFYNDYSLVINNY